MPIFATKEEPTMSFYEEHKDAVNMIISSMVTFFGGLTIKDWWAARREKNQDEREEMTVAMDSSEKALKMMQDLLDAVKEEKEDCQKGMRELREEMKAMKQEYEHRIDSLKNEYEQKIEALRQQIGTSVNTAP